MALESDKDLQILRNHLRDLANRAYTQNRYTFSGFLGPGEQEVLGALSREIGKIPWKLWGGRKEAERMMVRFGSEEELGYEEEFPIACIYIRPSSYKFGEELSHRDVLGALMNLGIERRLVGDIVAGDKQAYVFCQTSAVSYITANLDKVKRTSVLCKVVLSMEELPEEEVLVEDIQVASLRLDACISKIYHLSRAQALDMFRAGKVYVNSRLCENHSYIPSMGDRINVRGFGRFCLAEEMGMTRKGKCSLRVHIWK